MRRASSCSQQSAAQVDALHELLLHGTVVTVHCAGAPRAVRRCALQSPSMTLCQASGTLKVRGLNESFSEGSSHLPDGRQRRHHPDIVLRLLQRGLHDIGPVEDICTMHEGQKTKQRHTGSGGVPRGTAEGPTMSLTGSLSWAPLQPHNFFVACPCNQRRR